MTIPPLTEKVLTIAPEDRYHRQRLIEWWEQERIAKARVLVIGAGALGNEILKLLALIGVGNTLIYDMDIIESSNLSRTVLFREGDEKRPKAELAAQRMREINAEMNVLGRAEDVMHQAGLGIFLWADVVICGLDSRVARLFVNNACAQTERSWVDGAIEGFSGVVRVFEPTTTACYECTMNETDRRHVRERRSCAMLARNAVARGRTPSTAIAASLVAALEVQEAVKLLHGQPSLSGEGLHINGFWGDFSRVRYQRRDDCPSHDSLGYVAPLGLGVADVSLEALLSRAEGALGADAVLDLSRDIIVTLNCPACGFEERSGRALGAVREAEAVCPNCKAHRLVNFTSTISRDGEVDLALTPAQIGIPPFDIIVFRQGMHARQAWLFDADATCTLGPLAASFLTSPPPAV